MNIELRINVNEKPEADGTIRGQVVLEPLYRGFGHTIGNTLRRILLGRIQGAAVTNARIEGVNHEFTTINGVSEDVLNIILNLKALVVKMHGDEPRTLVLKAQGPAVVTAADIQCPSDVEIINHELEIANIAAGVNLNIEISVAKGYGYVPAEEHEAAQSVDVIPVDSVFMPIKNVAYVVDPVSVAGNSEKYDKLIVDVWSNGSVSISDAVGQAAAQLIELMNPLVEYTSQKIGIIKTVEERKTTEEKEEDRAHSVSVEELELSVRSYNCLKRANINSLGDLLQLSDLDLMNIKNFGKKSAEEVLDKLETMGYNLRTSRERSAI